MTKRFSDEAILSALRALAGELGRTPLAKEWTAGHGAPCFSVVIARFGGHWDDAIAAAGLPAIEPPQGWQAGNGRRPYWTDGRVGAALRLFAAVHGRVPSDKAYNRLKRGDGRFPTEERVRAYGAGVWSAALRRAGVAYSRLWDPWTADDDDYLLEHAGSMTLAAIGRHLRRSYPACKRRLYDLGLRARDAGGYLTGQQCAREYGVPITRVLKLVREGRLAAHKGVGQYWQIDPDAAARCPELVAPKQTHKATLTDVGDYRQRYGLRRTQHERARYQPTKWRAS